MRTLLVTCFAVLALLAVPAAALAIDQPEAIDDPASAFGGGESATIDLSASDPEPEAAQARPAPAAAARTAASAPGASRPATGRGELPFTGADDDLLRAAVLLALVLGLAGATAFALPARDPR